MRQMDEGSGNSDGGSVEFSVQLLLWLRLVSFVGYTQIILV